MLARDSGFCILFVWIAVVNDHSHRHVSRLVHLDCIHQSLDFELPSLALLFGLGVVCFLAYDASSSCLRSSGGMACSHEASHVVLSQRVDSLRRRVAHIVCAVFKMSDAMHALQIHVTVPCSWEFQLDVCHPSFDTSRPLPRKA
jgi:hypothetical protein